MVSILSESKLRSVEIIHFKTHPETGTKNSTFRPLADNQTRDTANLLQLSALIDYSRL